ncbi:MAG TPA: hypothetical protein VFO10_22745 [Oligoflexus sp.]|uniref:hypothetical protein n=1 Tax=Oligoflexus sp. TaxID=1971216 RepID=UPI002D802F24|nr:hypothetical protein [Oligoflexus sp.]HET9240099.1 hypothetical protein [Oligoflexus sp.]
MREFIFNILLLSAHKVGAEPGIITFTPDSLNEDCAGSWQATVNDGRTSLSFENFDLKVSSAAQVKHCRISWKPLIPEGCYAPSGRLVIRGHVHMQKVKAQLRLSHDLLGQGDTGQTQAIELEEGPFNASMELPPERFQKPWEAVKLITNLSLFLRPIKEGNDSVPSQGRVSVTAVELEGLRPRDCGPP